MRRYGGNLTKAKRIVLFFAIVIFIAAVLTLWKVADYNSMQQTAMPTIWIYGLFICPVLIVFLIKIAVKRFERVNR